MRHFFSLVVDGVGSFLLLQVTAGDGKGVPIECYGGGPSLEGCARPTHGYQGQALSHGCCDMLILIKARKEG